MSATFGQESRLSPSSMFEFIRRFFGGKQSDLDSAILRHTQGATVSHAGPFASLGVPTIPLEQAQPLYDDYVIPFYMHSLSQFGVDQEAAFQRIRSSLTDDLITTLLSDYNWRTRTAATYFALILQRSQHLDHIGRLLLRSDVCFVGATYCRYLAYFGTPEAADYLNRYLGYYLTQTQLHFDQADALAAIRYIDARSGTKHEEAHASALAAMCRARPEFMSHVSVEGLSADLHAAERLRQEPTGAEQDAAEQSATQSDSDSDRSSKPQTESERHSR